MQSLGTKLLDGYLESRSRPQRRLFEEHRDVTPGERGRGRCLAPETTVGFHLPGEIQQAHEIRGGQIEDRQEVLRHHDVEVFRSGTPR